MSLITQNLLEVTAERCYDVWAHEMGVLVPWAHVDEKTRRAFREVLAFVGEEAHCNYCGSDLSCPVCDPDVDVDFCIDCGSDLVCPECEGK